MLKAIDHQDMRPGGVDRARTGAMSQRHRRDSFRNILHPPAAKPPMAVAQQAQRVHSSRVQALLRVESA
jgi:hypothetical protein